MPNDIWTPPTNWNTGTFFTEAKAEQEITDDLYALWLAMTGDISVAVKHYHRTGSLAAMPGANQAGRIYLPSGQLYSDTGTAYHGIGPGPYDDFVRGNSSTITPSRSGHEV